MEEDGVSTETAIERLLRWKADPVQFVNDNWPDVGLESFQEEALREMAKGGKVTIRSGHGVGKTAVEAFICLWFMSTHFPCKVAISAPSAHQLDDVLRPEIGAWMSRSKWMANEFDLYKHQLILKADPHECFAAFRTGNRNNPDALQGFHGENFLFLLDEASGIDDRVYEVAQGALSTPHAKVLLAGNPTKTNGYFWRTHKDPAVAQFYHQIHVSCADSSRVSKQYEEEMLAYGADSNIYRVRFLGEFPKTDDDAVIPYEWVEAACGRDIRQSGDIIWGLDPARFGDDRTALCKRHGNVVPELPIFVRNKDTVQTAEWLKREYDKAEKEKLQPDVIYVDSIGVGAGVVDTAKALKLPVVGINVSERPANVQKYARLRDEIWFKGREWFEDMDVALPDRAGMSGDQQKLMDTFIAELTNQKYAILPAGKVKVESKEEMKRRGAPSPDLADAFLLTFGIARGKRRAKGKKIEYKRKFM